MRAIHCPLSQSDRLSDYLARSIRAGIVTISRSISSLTLLRHSPRSRLSSASVGLPRDCCQRVEAAGLDCRKFTAHLVTTHHDLLQHVVAAIRCLLLQWVDHQSSPSGTLSEMRAIFKLLFSNFLAQLHRDLTRT